MRIESFNKNETADLNVYYVGEDKGVAPGTVYGPLVRDFYVVECCTHGRGSNVVNDEEYAFSAGDCFVTFPGDIIVHKTDGKTDRKGFFCCVNGLKIRSYLHDAGVTHKNPIVDPRAFSKVLSVLKKLHANRDMTDAGAQLRALGAVNEMFGEILRYAEKKDDSGTYVERAVKIIETKYHENISVDDIAQEIGLNRCYFSTLFSKITGIPPHKYLLRLRIDKARTLLAQTRLTVSEIALMVGISPDCISRVFKSATGVTPARYREMNAKTAE